MNDNIEIIDSEEDDSMPFRYSITTFGTDYTIDGIIERLNKGKIFVPPFQRNYVWPIQRASRFIESLILGLPVPGIFLHEKDKKLQVVDGQQRITTLLRFYNNDFGGKPFKLVGVQEELQGKTINELTQGDRDRLDDCMLHATIFKQDEPTEDESSIFMVFERLNTGGLPLQPQEVRACVYYGEFNRVLSDLTENPHWRTIFGNKNPRMKEEELILRFFALYYNLHNYKKGLKNFLNTFMASNKNLNQIAEQDLHSLFEPTIELLHNTIGDTCFKKGNQVNAAILDSFMVAVARIGSGNLQSEKVKFVYETLLQTPEYLELVDSSTSSEKSVNGRIRMVIEELTK